MKYIGKSVSKADGIRKATGDLRYVDDIKMPNMLYAAVKRSPYPHAKIISIDTSKAKELKGVKVIITGEDVPNKVGSHLGDKTFLALDTVRYVGEGVAAVAAETEEIAKKAVSLIKVDYEKLEPITNAKSAMKKDSPLVHPNLHNYKKAKVLNYIEGTNICEHFKLRKGNAKEVLEKADYIFENEYYVPHIQHCAIENHCAIAKYERDGNVTVWSCTQSPYIVRGILADVYEIPLNKLRIISPAVGGGFGSKTGNTLEGIVLPLAKRAKGRPVKLTYSREESFSNSFLRPALFAKYKTAVNKTGKILGMEVEYIWDGGAYAEFITKITKSAGYTAVGPYDIENIWCDSYCVYTNNLVGGLYRSFGMSEIHFGIEQNMDYIAHEIGIDPLEFRKINAQKPGGKMPTSASVYHNCAYINCLDKVAKSIELDKPSEKPKERWKVRAKGIAGGAKAPSMPPNASSSAIIKLNEDGTAYLSISSQDIGQGSNTVMAQIAAEILSIPTEKISVNTGDTATTPYEWQTVASRTTYSTGNAVKKACEDAKSQILELASIKFNEPKENIALENEQIICINDKSKNMKISDIALGLVIKDGSGIHGPIIGRGSFVPEGIKGLDKETGQGEKPAAFWTYGANGVEIEIDIETGQIEILKITSCWDVGKVMNPTLIEGQCEGAMMQGIGSTILEEVIFENGKFINPSFTNYKIPNASDMPKMVCEFLENLQHDGPFGARAIGEPAMIATAPAIANAVYNALGVRICELPITPEKILKHIYINN